MGIWLCGGCFKTHSLRSKCRHGKGSHFVSPPDCDDGVVRFVFYDLTKPHVPSSLEQLDHVDDLVQVQHGVLPLCLYKTFRLRSNLECKSAIKRQRQEESIVNAIRSWSSPGGSLQVLRETLAESSPHFSDVDEEDIDLGERNIKQCKRKICDGHYTAAVRFLFSSDKIKSFPRGTSYGQDGLRAQHLMDCLSGSVVAISYELVSFITQVVNLFLDGKCLKKLGEYIASAPLTPLVKPGGGICPIAVAGETEAILHSVNRLIEACGDDVGLSMLLVDFKNAFNLVDRELDCTTGSTPCGRANECSKLSPCPFAFFSSVTSFNMLYFNIRTCPPNVFEYAQRSFDVALHSSLECIVTASGPGFADCLLACRLSFFGMLPCSRVFAVDIYGDHDVSCARIIGIKHRHNVDGGLDVCVDLTGSSPLKQNGMVDFVPGRAVIDDAQRKRDKYMAKCAAIGYGFLPFSFSSLGKLEADAVTLLKRIRKFSMAQDIEARAAVHILNRISFAIAKRVRAQIVSRLPFNLL
nr:hypothetical protein [Tanacetum cinerariifolium]